MVVADVIVETETIKTLRLVFEGGALPFYFQTGQYVDLTVDVGGDIVHRSYSISSSARERGFIDLTIKREPDGYASKVLCDNIVVGDRFAVRGPFGQFVFDETSARRLILVGSGVGVTPLASIIRTLRDIKWRGHVQAFFGFRREADALFLSELNEAGHHGLNLDLFCSYSRPEHSQTQEVGRLHPKMIKKKAAPLRGVDVFVCGPAAMMNEMKTGLPKLGANTALIRVEDFGPPAKDLTKGGVHEVSFEPAGISIHSQAGETLLDIGERAGLKIDYSCRTGTCGLCVGALQRGHVELVVDDALDDDEIEKGHVLTCQSYPLSRCSIKI
ncbi:MAG: iron-sulfur cluster-binding domain-containing protein [Pseudomonadota bacterium]